MANVLATKYARALLDLADSLSPQEQENLLEGLRAFRNLYAGSPELRLAMDSPAVVLAARRRVVTELVARLGLSDLNRRFLLVVTDHGRLNLMAAIVSAIEEQFDERAGRVTADVRVASEVTAVQKQAIEAQLTKSTGKQVRARFLVDPALVGGFRAEIGSTVYDASVRGQLETLRHRFRTVA
jgi:F-type H+-transporting ATPase subunit delta